MLHGAGRGLDGGRADGRRATRREEHAVHAARLGAAQQRAHVLRVLERVEHQHERCFAALAGAGHHVVEGRPPARLHDERDALVAVETRQRRQVPPSTSTTGMRSVVACSTSWSSAARRSGTTSSRRLGRRAAKASSTGRRPATSSSSSRDALRRRQGRVRRAAAGRRRPLRCHAADAARRRWRRDPAPFGRSPGPLPEAAAGDRHRRARVGRGRAVGDRRSATVGRVRGRSVEPAGGARSPGRAAGPWAGPVRVASVPLAAGSGRSPPVDRGRSHAGRSVRRAASRSAGRSGVLPARTSGARSWPGRRLLGAGRYGSDGVLGPTRLGATGLADRRARCRPACRPPGSCATARRADPVAARPVGRRRRATARAARQVGHRSAPSAASAGRRACPRPRRPTPPARRAARRSGPVLRRASRDALVEQRRDLRPGGAAAAGLVGLHDPSTRSKVTQRCRGARRHRPSTSTGSAHAAVELTHQVEHGGQSGAIRRSSSMRRLERVPAALSDARLGVVVVRSVVRVHVERRKAVDRRSTADAAAASVSSLNSSGAR